MLLLKSSKMLTMNTVIVLLAFALFGCFLFLLQYFVCRCRSIEGASRLHEENPHIQEGFDSGSSLNISGEDHFDLRVRA